MFTKNKLSYGVDVKMYILSNMEFKRYTPWCEKLRRTPDL